MDKEISTAVRIVLYWCAIIFFRTDASGIEFRCQKL